MKKLIFIGCLLVTALILNVSISVQNPQSQTTSLSALYKIAHAQPEEPEEGMISQTEDCSEMVLVCANPFDPTDCQWVSQDGEITTCLLNWPDWGCTETGCVLFDYSY